MEGNVQVIRIEPTRGVGLSSTEKSYGPIVSCSTS